MRNTLMGGLVLSMLAVLAPAAGADLVGVTLSDPVVVYDSTGSVTYDSASNMLVAHATLLFFRNGTTVRQFLPLGSSTITVKAVVDENGALVSGVDGFDLLLSGSLDLDGDGTPEYTGDLLTAEVRAFGWLDVTTTDRFDFCCEMTDGSLASLFGPCIGVTLTSEHSSFTGSFEADFAGGAKGNVGKTPVPSNLLAEIGDYVWEDADFDGVQDAGEQGVEGVLVHLYDAAGLSITSTLTDANGFYKFDQLTPGLYSVGFGLPEGYAFTLQDQGSDDAADSDADAAGMAPATFLDMGESDMTWDAGILKPSIQITHTGYKLCGNTRTIGFWKNNINKHLGCGKGTQVSKADLLAWLRSVNAFYLPQPFQLGNTDRELLTNACSVLSYGGCDMVRKTMRQLLACELNLLSGTYALKDKVAHEALCQMAEDALNTAGTKLCAIHELLDDVNNLGEGCWRWCWCCCGCGGRPRVLVTTITSVLPAPQTVDVKVCMDKSLVPIAATSGGTLRPHGATWTVDLPAGVAQTQLLLFVKFTRWPAGNNVGCGGADSTCVGWQPLCKGAFLSIACVE